MVVYTTHPCHFNYDETKRTENTHTPKMPTTSSGQNMYLNSKNTTSIQSLKITSERKYKKSHPLNSFSCLF